MLTHAERVVLLVKSMLVRLVDHSIVIALFAEHCVVTLQPICVNRSLGTIIGSAIG